ncbi:MAG TPA: hypothetical protein VJ577_20285 [Burkholderiaceae bacterium]|nr:hypothetical protein [Burkholderiaceae bacterium]
MAPPRHLADFYDRLYFHELNVREQINARLQVPLALIVSNLGLLGFILQNLNRASTGWNAFWFYIWFVTACLFAGVSGYHFIRAAWGYEWEVLPTADELHKYRQECDNIFADWDNADTLTEEALKTALYNAQIKCATANTLINEMRSAHYANTIKNLIIAICSSIGAFAIFYVAELDKTQEIAVVKPIEMKPSEITVKLPVQVTIPQPVLIKGEPDVQFKPAATATTSSPATSESVSPRRSGSEHSASTPTDETRTK